MKTATKKDISKQVETNEQKIDFRFIDNSIFIKRTQEAKEFLSHAGIPKEFLKNK